MASYSIADMRAIAPFYASKLKAAGIRSTTKLLERAATPKLRKELAQTTNIPMRLILDWANIADLMRVRGIALDYAELLLAAGVDTVKDLGRRNAATLVARMAEINCDETQGRAPAEREARRPLDRGGEGAGARHGVLAPPACRDARGGPTTPGMPKADVPPPKLLRRLLGLRNRALARAGREGH